MVFSVLRHWEVDDPFRHRLNGLQVANDCMYNQDRRYLWLNEGLRLLNRPLDDITGVNKALLVE